MIPYKIQIIEYHRTIFYETNFMISLLFISTIIIQLLVNKRDLYLEHRRISHTVGKGMNLFPYIQFITLGKMIII
jgi:hypothetical protein